MHVASRLRLDSHIFAAGARGRERGHAAGSSPPQSRQALLEEWSVAKLALAAGLYPSLVRVDKGRHRFKTKFFTRENGKVQPHPSSVNAAHNDFQHRWLLAVICVREGVAYLMRYEVFSRIHPKTVRTSV